MFLINPGKNKIFVNTIFVSSHMYPENPDGTQVIVGSMNMGYISDTIAGSFEILILSELRKKKPETDTICRSVPKARQLFI